MPLIICKCNLSFPKLAWRDAGVVAQTNGSLGPRLSPAFKFQNNGDKKQINHGNMRLFMPQLAKTQTPAQTGWCWSWGSLTAIAVSVSLLRPDSGFPTPVTCNEHPPIMTCLQHCVIPRSVTMSRKPMICHDDITVSVAPVPCWPQIWCRTLSTAQKCGGGTKTFLEGSRFILIRYNPH